MLDLDIGQRSEATRAPVDQALAPVEEAVVEKTDEYLAHGFGKPFVHREACTLPVAGCAETAQLTKNGPTRLLFPLPHALHEGLSAEGLTRESFLSQLTLHDVLGRDAGMVHPRYPQRVTALHAAPTDENVLE